ncbi:type II toxin-antitoxin system VapC family toxin [Paracidovorax avenae]|uniref:type II toxin-antitoxin system VapC family toxin n=1 Tax=Paracidovorax avenae TaxID=80867 RepID=UPI000D1661E1|nr:PIN domain-containing protein [Paracidovorax avenae]AVS81471.1 PIN domain-containing protein [Paracidovorax avenae]AVT02962.1 PIN domain-containing protein [Paracidovorax avenae]AVT06195.1 PIN domain-containing protein [Paracidovorax avenae]AVT09774.1 PIN domain-containing protein [Paracidovorax avenae]AVT16606.1 PIN domain-containing protein [Paracidovorax avenae]
MSEGFLLDTNLLIGAFDGEPGNAEHEAATVRLRQLLEKPSVQLAITPLIRYEVLRGAARISVDELDKVLDGFREFEIRGSDGRRAAELFREAKAQGLVLNKRAFDLFHCVCADANQLDIASQDGDIPKIKTLIEASKDAKA